MLTIYGADGSDILKMGDEGKVIYYPSGFFNTTYETNWLNDDFGRRVITDIQEIDVMDKSIDVERILLENGMHIRDLAGGTKNILTIKHINGYIHRAAMLGENCYKYVFEISKEKDVEIITAHYISDIEDWVDGTIVNFPDIGVVAKTFREFDLGCYELGGWLSSKGWS